MVEWDERQSMPVWLPIKTKKPDYYNRKSMSGQAWTSGVERQMTVSIHSKSPLPGRSRSMRPHRALNNEDLTKL